MNDWKPGDLAVVEIKTVGLTDLGFVGVGYGPVYTIPETALMPLADHLSDMWEWQAKKLLNAQARVAELEASLVELKPVDDFFDRPQDDLAKVVASLKDGDVVEARWVLGEAAVTVNGPIRSSDGRAAWSADTFYELRDRLGVTTDTLTHVRIIKRAPKPLPKEPPVGTWVRDRLSRVWILKEGGLWSLRGGDTRTFYRWKEILEDHGPVRILTPGDPIGGAE